MQIGPYQRRPWTVQRLNRAMARAFRQRADAMNREALCENRITHLCGLSARIEAADLTRSLLRAAGGTL